MVRENLNLTVHSDSTQPDQKFLPDTVLSDPPSDSDTNTPSISIHRFTMVNVEAEQKQDILTLPGIAALSETNPELANRFMTVYEQDHQADNNIKDSQATVIADIPKRHRRGQYIFGFIVFSVMMGVIASATITTCFGYPWFGISEVFGGLGCLKFLIWDPYKKKPKQD